ncbi:hypothetical protein BDR26DRAFT_921677 [Obelidium mucronatum]|nr:hypothetical protein BDR26DRAFT_921677 [Obelidium mucronatum]
MSFKINSHVWTLPALQLATSIALITHRLSTTSASVYDAYDSTWCFVIQLVFSSIMLVSSLRKVKNEDLQKLIMSVGLGITVVLGCVSVVAFMFAFNYKTLNCSDTTVYTDNGDYSNQSACARSDGNIARNCVFWIIEVLTIHPLISHLIELWSNELWFTTSPSDFALQD